eukprot:5267157-Prymnesium_polylepis.1
MGLVARPWSAGRGWALGKARCTAIQCARARSHQFTGRYLCTSASAIADPPPPPPLHSRASRSAPSVAVAHASSLSAAAAHVSSSSPAHATRLECHIMRPTPPPQVATTATTGRVAARMKTRPSTSRPPHPYVGAGRGSSGMPSS